MIGEMLWSFRKCRKMQVWRRLGKVAVNNLFSPTTLDKIFGIMQRSPVKMDKTSKICYLILRVFWQVLSKFDFWKENRVLGCVSTQNFNFSNPSWFLKILNLKWFFNSWGNSCTKFVILDIKYRFTCADSNLCQVIENGQNIMIAIVD